MRREAIEQYIDSQVGADDILDTCAARKAAGQQNPLQPSDCEASDA